MDNNELRKLAGLDEDANNDQEQFHDGFGNPLRIGDKVVVALRGTLEYSHIGVGIVHKHFGKNRFGHDKFWIKMNQSSEGKPYHDTIASKTAILKI